MTPTASHRARARVFWIACAVLPLVVLEVAAYVATELLRSRYVTPYTHGISVTGWPRDATVPFRSGSVRVDVITNDLGFRGPRLTPRKPPGTYRVAVFGDSVAAGWGVAQDEMFSSRLAELLKSEPGTFEVANFAVIASGPGTAFGLYRDVARRFGPDLVVLGIFVGNDFVDAEKELARGLRLEDRNPIAVPGFPFSYHLLSFVLTRRDLEAAERERIAALPRFAELDGELRALVRGRAVHLGLLGVGLATPDAITTALTRITPAEVAALGTIVRDFAAAVTADGSRFLVVAVPMSVQVSREQVDQLRRMRFRIPDALVGERLPQRLVAGAIEPWIAATDEARTRTVAYLDVAPEFETRSASGPLYLPWDVHPGAGGHRVVADALLREIRRWTPRRVSAARQEADSADRHRADTRQIFTLPSLAIIDSSDVRAGSGTPSLPASSAGGTGPPHP